MYFTTLLNDCVLFSSFLNNSFIKIHFQAKRDQIVALKNAGIPNKDIDKQLNMSRKTVYNVWKHYNDTGTTTSKQIPGRLQNIQTRKLVKAIQK